MNLFVGSLAKDVTDEDLVEAFSVYGKVESATVVKDRISNQSRGFGFVEMPNGVEARKAVEALSGRHLIKGRAIMVNEARPKEGGKRGGRRW
jgi:RNA recognition motif-containing protein